MTFVEFPKIGSKIGKEINTSNVEYPNTQHKIANWAIGMGRNLLTKYY